jgi:hypothetical protein
LSWGSRVWGLRRQQLKPTWTKPPTDHGLLKKLQEVDDQIARGDIELKDEVKMKLTDDEKTAHNNTWRTHQETTESLKKSRGPPVHSSAGWQDEAKHGLGDHYWVIWP